MTDSNKELLEAISKRLDQQEQMISDLVTSINSKIDNSAAAQLEISKQLFLALEEDIKNKLVSTYDALAQTSEIDRSATIDANAEMIKIAVSGIKEMMQEVYCCIAKSGDENTKYIAKLIEIKSDTTRSLITTLAGAEDERTQH